MRFERSPRALVELFESLVGDRAERRAMFGCPCAFVGGHLSAGLFGSQLFLRLGEPDRATLLAAEGAEPFDPMGGRPMREYVVLPYAMLEDAATVRQWLDRALTHGASLPPKVKERAERRRAGRGKSSRVGRGEGGRPAQTKRTRRPR